MSRWATLLLLALAVSAVAVATAQEAGAAAKATATASATAAAAAAAAPAGKDCQDICEEVTKEVCAKEEVTKQDCKELFNKAVNGVQCKTVCSGRRLSFFVKSDASCQKVCKEAPIISVRSTRCTPVKVVENVCKNATEEVCKQVCTDAVPAAAAVATKGPMYPNILAAAEAAGLKTLAAAVKASDLAANATDGATTWTVFAPSDAAFAAAIKKLGTTPAKLLADKDTLNKVLKFHVLPSSVMPSDTLIADLALATALGEDKEVEIGRAGKSVTVTGDGTKATVTKADVTAGKSVIHVIDTVLVPK